MLQARIFWILVASVTMIPALVPSRTFRSLRKAPFFLAALLPIVAFIAIGRTVEVRKLMDEADGESFGGAVAAAASVAVEGAQVAKRGLTVRGLNAGSAGSGLSKLDSFL